MVTHGRAAARHCRALTTDEEHELASNGEQRFNDSRCAAHQLCGAPMFYSAFTKDATLQLLRDARYEVVGMDDEPNRALLVLARAV